MLRPQQLREAILMFPVPFPAPSGFPTAARLLAPAPECRFCHLSRATVAGHLDALDAWNAVMAHRLPSFALAVKLRDAISARFGVERIGGFSGTQHRSIAAGEKLDFFLVEEARPERLLLTARDRHLDVMTCVTATPCGTETEVAITSSVVTHNLFGRLYMLPVGPAHRFIAAAMLRRLQRQRARTVQSH